MKYEEHNLQVEIVRFLKKNNFFYFAIPNGGQRNPLQGRILKSEGVIAGVADLIVFSKIKKNTLYFFELKTSTGKQSNAQYNFQKTIEQYGFFYKIIKNLDELKTELKILGEL